jgi:hypothetical protein
MKQTELLKKINLDEGELLELIDQCCNERDHAIKVKQTRVKDWQENEDLYYLRKQPVLPNMSNYLLPIMPGFIDTLLSKTDDIPMLSFSPQETADINNAKKAEKAWEFDSSPDRGDWAFKDILTKKMNSIYGRSMSYIYATKVGGVYLHHYELVDIYDSLIDPSAGGVDEEKADYIGIDNIVRSEYSFDNKKIYIEENVKKIFEGISRDTIVENSGENQEKLNRRESLGVDSSQYLKSEKTTEFTLLCTTYKGNRYYVLFSHKDKIPVRVEKLVDMFPIINPYTGKPYWPFATWAIYPDPFEFYSPSPADRLRDIIKSQSVLINQEIDNRNYQNYGMIGYDTSVIKNPALITPRPRGLVPMDLKGKRADNAIFQFRYNLFSNTESLFNVLGNINAKESGITPEAQGMSDKDKKVGVYEGDVASVADRMGLLNKSYKRYYEKLGKLWLNNLISNYTNKTAITIFGEDAISSVELKRKDVNEFSKLGVIIKSGSVEAKAKEMLNQSISKVIAEGINFDFVNKKETYKIILETAGASKEQIEKIMDVSGNGHADSIISASQDNQNIISGKGATPNKSANNIHLNHHLKFIDENREYLSDEQLDALYEHIKLEIPISIKNFAFQAKMLQITNQPNINQNENTLPNGESVEQIPENAGLNNQVNN